MKIATTITEQIQLLNKRGMSIDCGELKVQEHLLDIGYYRLGSYWFPFEIDNNHNFRPNTKFTTIIDLYYLDVDIRYLLMRAINRIEINIRTQIIYIVSNEYKDLPTWFSDPKVMKKNYTKNFKRFYDRTTKSKPIKKHHKKYINDKYAPAWKTLEFFTFGGIFTIFSNLKDDELKRKIIKKYDIKKIDIFENYFKTIVYIRNICAHNGVLYDAKTRFAIKPSPLIKSKHNDTNSLNTAIKVILYFLGNISTNRKFELTTSINDLFSKFKDSGDIKNIIEEKIGYNYSKKFF